MAIYVNSEKAKFYLSNADRDKAFFLQSGQALFNIYDLYNYLASITQSEYSLYANKYKNDFAAWVEGVYLNERLKNNLLSARTPKEAALYVGRNIKMLERNTK